MESGEIGDGAKLDKILQKILKASPQRIKYLKSLKHNRTFLLLWPKLRIINTWTGGNCSFTAKQLKKITGGKIKVIDPGYVASEFRGTINLIPGKNLAVPQIDENFYEFKLVNEFGEAAEDFLGIEGILPGNEYNNPAPNELSKRADAILKRLNSEYFKKRNSGRLLAPVVYYLISGTGEAYRTHRISQGQRESQYKDILNKDMGLETFPFFYYATIPSTKTVTTTGETSQSSLIAANNVLAAMMKTIKNPDDLQLWIQKNKYMNIL